MTLWVRASTCEFLGDTVQSPAPTLLDFQCKLKARVLALLRNMYSPMRFSISFSSSSGKNDVSTEEVESQGAEGTSTQHSVFSSHFLPAVSRDRGMSSPVRVAKHHPGPSLGSLPPTPGPGVDACQAHPGPHAVAVSVLILCNSCSRLPRGICCVVRLFSLFISGFQISVTFFCSFPSWRLGVDVQLAVFVAEERRRPRARRTFPCDPPLCRICSDAPGHLLSLRMPVLTPGLTKEVSAEGTPCPVAGLSLYDADFILKVPLAKLSPTCALLRPPRVGDALGTGPSCFTRVGGGGGGGSSGGVWEGGSRSPWRSETSRFRVYTL